MKKIILSIIAILCISIGASAMNLKEAYQALSNIPNVNVRQPDYNLPATIDNIQNVQIAGAYNLNAQQVYQTGTAAQTVLNLVPLSTMINGGNNGQAAAFIYAEPNNEGSNDILIVVMSGYTGSVVTIYGTTDTKTIESINNAPLTLQGKNLTLETTLPDGNEFNIIINKGR